MMIFFSYSFGISYTTDALYQIHMRMNKTGECLTDLYKRDFCCPLCWNEYVCALVHRTDKRQRDKKIIH